jgi:hypothetical protein
MLGFDTEQIQVFAWIPYKYQGERYKNKFTVNNKVDSSMLASIK